jgi:hypothetical protein
VIEGLKEEKRNLGLELRTRLAKLDDDIGVKSKIN